MTPYKELTGEKREEFKKWLKQFQKENDRSPTIEEVYDEATYELDKENAGLKERLKKLTVHDTNTVLKGLEMEVLKNSHRDRANNLQDQLTKAKEIIRALLKHTYGQNLNTQNDFDLYLGRIKQAEQFISEVEK